MSEITLALEHPSLGCGEIIARYDLSEIQEKAYQQGRTDERTKILNVFKTFMYDINEEEIKSHIGTESEVTWLLNWRNAFENELKQNCDNYEESEDKT